MESLGSNGCPFVHHTGVFTTSRGTHLASSGKNDRKLSASISVWCDKFHVATLQWNACKPKPHICARFWKLSAAMFVRPCVIQHHSSHQGWASWRALAKIRAGLIGRVWAWRDRFRAGSLQRKACKPKLLSMQGFGNPRQQWLSFLHRTVVFSRRGGPTWLALDEKTAD